MDSITHHNKPQHNTMATIIKKENGSVVFENLKGQYTNRQFNGGAVSLRNNGKTFDIFEFGQLSFSFDFADITQTQVEPDAAIDAPATATELLALLQLSFFFSSSTGGGGGVSALMYAANLSQFSTFAPAATEVTPSTLGATITFARLAPGVYTATASAAVFTTGKTFVTPTPGIASGAGYLTYEISSTSVIVIRTYNGTTGLTADSIMTNAGFKIEVYPEV